MAIIGIAVQYAFLPSKKKKKANFLERPWQLNATASKFLSVLSGFGIVMAPLT